MPLPGAGHPAHRLGRSARARRQHHQRLLDRCRQRPAAAAKRRRLAVTPSRWQPNDGGAVQRHAVGDQLGAGAQHQQALLDTASARASPAPAPASAGRRSGAAASARRSDGLAGRQHDCGDRLAGLEQSTFNRQPRAVRRLPAMTTPRRSMPIRSAIADMFVATGVSVVDPFTYLELDGRRIIVASVLRPMLIERDSHATEVWPDDQFGTRELRRQGWLRRRVDGAGAAGAGAGRRHRGGGCRRRFRSRWRLSPRRGIAITPDRELFELRRRIKDEGQLNAIRAAQRATEAAFVGGSRAARLGLAGAARPGRRWRAGHL